MSGESVRVSLHDGFEDDAVRILLDGNEVFADDHVSTRHEISRAGGFAVPLKEDRASALTVLIPGRRIEETIALDPSTRFVALSLRDGELTLRFSDQPFRSM